MNYRELQNQLRTLKSEGYDVQVKLNDRFEVLEAEFKRLNSSRLEAESDSVEVLTADEFNEWVGLPCDRTQEVEKCACGFLSEAECAADSDCPANYPNFSEYDGVTVLAVNYCYRNRQVSVDELNWVTHGQKAGIRKTGEYGETYYAPACSLVYCKATNCAFGHDPEAVAEVRVVGGYPYQEGFIRRTGTVTATMLTCDVCNYQQSELPEPKSVAVTPEEHKRFMELEEEMFGHTDLDNADILVSTSELPKPLKADNPLENANGIVANFIHFDSINRVVIGDRGLEAERSLRDPEFLTGDEAHYSYVIVPCCLLPSFDGVTVLQDPLDHLLVEPYTESMSAEDDALMAGVVAEDDESNFYYGCSYDHSTDDLSNWADVPENDEPWCTICDNTLNGCECSNG